MVRSPRRNKPMSVSPFLRSVASTAGASAATILANVVVIRLLTEGFGPERFGVYSLANRLVALIAPIATLSMSSALSRYTAMAQGDRSRREYLLGGLLLSVAPGFVIALVAAPFGRYLAGILFQDATYFSLALATLSMVVGYGAFTALQAFYFGSMAVTRANLWQLGVGALGPLIIAAGLFRRGSIELLMWLLAALYMMALVPLISALVRSAAPRPTIAAARHAARELFRYGFPRVPAGVALAGLLSLGPILAPHVGSVEEAGFLLVGLSIFRLAEVAPGAFGLVMLPKVSHLVAEGQHDFLKQRVGDIVAFVCHAGLFATVHLLIWSDEIVRAWLPDPYSQAIPLLRILSLALVPYLAYVMLRSVIDAVETRAINTRNLLVAFGVSLVVSLLAGKYLGSMGLAIGTATGLGALAYLTVNHLWKRYRFDLRGIAPKALLVVNAALLAAALMFKEALRGLLSSDIQIIALGAGGELGLVILYWAWLRRAGVGWITQLRARILTRTVDAGSGMG